MRDILRKALDLEPIPLTLPFAEAAANAPTYRFTRPVHDMVDRHLVPNKEAK